MSGIKSRILKFEQSFGKHRKLTTENYRNCRKYVWAGTLPDHPKLKKYVKAIRQDLLLFCRTPAAAFAVDTKNRKLVCDNGIIIENLTDAEIVELLAPLQQ